MNSLDKKLIQKMEAGIRANGKLDNRRPRENKENENSINDLDNKFNRETLSYGNPNDGRQEFLRAETCEVVKKVGPIPSDEGQMLDITLSIISNEEYFDCFDSNKISSSKVMYKTIQSEDTIWADMSTCYVMFTYHPDTKDDGLGMLARLLRGGSVKVMMGNSQKKELQFPIGDFALHDFYTEDVNEKLLYRITLYNNIQQQ